MTQRILITGSEGLVGRVVAKELLARGYVVKGLDLKGVGDEQGDICDYACVEDAVSCCDGILHLAAVSRVVWGERDPDLCWATNVGGLKNVLAAMKKRSSPPWLIFASSREVYGQPKELPATEDTPLNPVNIYARSKAEGERLVLGAHLFDCLRVSTIRLSNVYGRTSDHVDRVIPAFARAAVLGEPLRVDGYRHTFDFTHVDDVCRGIILLIHHLMSPLDCLPPIQFVSGTATTLGELALQAIAIADSESPIVEAPPRNFDVAQFYGSPSLAMHALNWAPQVSLKEGLSRLIADYARELL